MIVGPLKSNPQISLIILIITCLALWFSISVFVPGTITNHQYPENILYNLIFGYGISFWFNQIIGLFSIISGAFLINLLAINQEIVSKTNYLPAFFYVIFSFTLSPAYTVQPILLANLGAIPALFFLLESYREEQALSSFFKTGILVSLSAFIYVHYLYLFIICFIAIMILRPFQWREWLILLLGLLTPFYIYAGVDYLGSNTFLNTFALAGLSIISFDKPEVSEYHFAFLVILFLLILFALFHNASRGFGNKIKTQKTKFIIVWMLVICTIMVFNKQNSDFVMIPCIIPLSLLIGDYLGEIKQLKIANTLLTLFLGAFVLVFFHAIGIL